MRRPRSMIFRVAVSGPSMVPTLRSGDVVLAVRRRRVQPGDVVLARYRSMPDRLVVKRVERSDDRGYRLVSDNPYAGGDSARHGVADVEAQVLLRLAPGRPQRVR
ncbi:MAG: S24 family peptidase [Jatrophihabitans sp.]